METRKPRAHRRRLGAVTSAVLAVAALALLRWWSAAQADPLTRVSLLPPSRWGYGRHTVYVHSDGPGGTSSMTPAANVTRVGVVQIRRSLPEPPGPMK